MNDLNVHKVSQTRATFSQGWNRARQRRGHVFQGLYKAVPFNRTDADAQYFKALARLYPSQSRAGRPGGWLTGATGFLSLQQSAIPPERKRVGLALVSGRILRAFSLADDGRGRRAYVAWLEARAANDGGKIDGKG